MLKIRRVYEPPSSRDGLRVLVDRVWPRGLGKDAARIDDWLRDIAPSTQLRRWFGHDPAKWVEFARRYRRELDANPAATDRLRQLLRAHSTVNAALRGGRHGAQPGGRATGALCGRARLFTPCPPPADRFALRGDQARLTR